MSFPQRRESRFLLSQRPRRGTKKEPANWEPSTGNRQLLAQGRRDADAPITLGTPRLRRQPVGCASHTASHPLAKHALDLIEGRQERREGQGTNRLDLCTAKAQHLAFLTRKTAGRRDNRAERNRRRRKDEVFRHSPPTLHHAFPPGSCYWAVRVG